MDNEKSALKGAPLEPAVFIPAVIIVLLVGLIMSFWPDAAAKGVGAAYSFITKYFSSLFMMAGVAAFILVMWLAFGRYGQVKLGTEDEEPEFSKFSWICMLFCAGVGIGLMIWSIVEPVYYIQGTPMGIEPMSKKAFEWAHMLPQFHWGFSAWAIYTLPTIPIAYSVYVRRQKIFRVSDSCAPILGRQVDGPVGKLIELFVLVGTVGAVGTSLGLAVPLISKLVHGFTGAPDNMSLKLVVVCIVFIIFGLSVYLGLEKGMQNLTRINVWLAFTILALVLVLGPTGFIFDLWTNSLGLLFDNFFALTFQTEPYRLLGDGKDAWPQWWTVFYWAWWVAYAPVIALFVARISKGRTIKELVIAECFWGTLGCWLFLAIFGAYSLYTQQTGLVDVVGIQNDPAQGDPGACVAVMSSLPLYQIIIPIYSLLCFVFLGTTLDASAQSLANICSKKGYSDLPPLRWNRMLWASLLSLFGVGILVTGGEKALKTVQTSTIVGGVILVPVMAILAASLLKSLREDFGCRLKPKKIILSEECRDNSSTE